MLIDEDNTEFKIGGIYNSEIVHNLSLVRDYIFLYKISNYYILNEYVYE